MELHGAGALADPLVGRGQPRAATL
jgi:hypothetical protein